VKSFPVILAEGILKKVEVLVERQPEQWLNVFNTGINLNIKKAELKAIEVLRKELNRKSKKR
jgi:hypothetical protein